MRTLNDITNITYIFVVIYRAEIYGPVYRINILHYIILGVTCPEATKVKLINSEIQKLNL